MCNHLDYLKIKYKHMGRGMEHGDCANLVIMYYKREFKVTLRDIGEDYIERWERTDKRYFSMEVLSDRGFFEVTYPRYGDVVIASKRGVECHCGIMLDSENVLHTTRSGTKVNDIYSMGYGLKAVRFLRHKDLTNVD